MSQTDRVIRILVFAFSVALLISGALPLMMAITLVAVTSVLAVTSFVGYCLIYGMFGWSTLNRKTPKD